MKLTKSIEVFEYKCCCEECYSVKTSKKFLFTIGYECCKNFNNECIMNKALCCEEDALGDLKVGETYSFWYYEKKLKQVLDIYVKRIK